MTPVSTLLHLPRLFMVQSLPLPFGGPTYLATGHATPVEALDIGDAGVVSKYGALRDLLAQHGRESVSSSFEKLSELIPGGLPPSAYRHGAWWSNEAAGRHVQSVSGWMTVMSYPMWTFDLPFFKPTH